MNIFSFSPNEYAAINSILSSSTVFNRQFNDVMTADSNIISPSVKNCLKAFVDSSLQHHHDKAHQYIAQAVHLSKLKNEVYNYPHFYKFILDCLNIKAKR
jgi:hypothetical protein